METNDGLFLSIHEANLTDYAAMNLIPKEGSMTLKANLTPWSTGEKVFMKAPGVTPWRTMIVAESAGDLLLSRLMLNLNEPCRIQDTSW
ncbi:UNVERIFIED_CONTAM: glycoside hydrolase family 97 N-terminal domain-containing protein, partial [Bacteroidetes bacterium 56_B9]